ncbi:hypothetical protein M5D96_002479 [Drosophila gunungcola]|uniref:Uncharacterized protein n=1 Tax=Drosophila gunungcola TaxID=103775 RepID=A0A9Q0BVJ1_9MUSC|nr:hypothetical protein M5D96_002479 [Drosophila gunungcola]
MARCLSRLVGLPSAPPVSSSSSPSDDESVELLDEALESELSAELSLEEWDRLPCCSDCGFP